MEAIEQTWNGSSGSTLGWPRCTATINGDLRMVYLEISGTPATTTVNPTAQVITDVELEIGGQKIDKHTDSWMNIWSIFNFSS